MKFLIAGLGSIGRRHLRNLRYLGEKDILLYRTRQSTLPEDELEGLPVEYDLAAALAHQPKAVIIANPTALHLDVAIPAAEAGCHLFIEKPISHSLASVGDLQRLVERNGLSVLVGYHFRFHPGLHQVKQYLDENAIGRILSVHVHWGEYLPGWHPWEDYRRGYSARSDLGGGVVLTLSHPLDYLRWLIGEVADLWAFTAKIGNLELEVENIAEIGLRFASGALGSVHLDYNQQPPSHYLEMIGTQGTLRWDNADGVVHIYRVGKGEWMSSKLPEGFERNDLFLAEMRHFLEVVEGNAQPLCSMDDGIRALKLALAVHASHERGEIQRL